MLDLNQLFSLLCKSEAYIFQGDFLTDDGAVTDSQYRSWCIYDIDNTNCRSANGYLPSHQFDPADDVPYVPPPSDIIRFSGASNIYYPKLTVHIKR